MSIDSSIVPVIAMDPPDGKLLYADTSICIGKFNGINSQIDVQGDISYSGLVYDRSYPPTYGVIDSTAELQWPDAATARINYIANPPDTSDEPSDLKNTNVNIRKIKPDANSKLKRV